MPNNTSPWVFLTNTETQVTRYWWSKDSEMFLETKAMITSAFWRSLTTFNSCEMMAKKSAKKCATTGYAQSFCYADYKPVTLSFVIVMHGFLFLRSLVLRVTMQFNHSWYATILLKKKLTIRQKTCDKNDIHRYTHRKAHFSGLSNYMQGDLNKSLLSSPSLQLAAE